MAASTNNETSHFEVLTASISLAQIPPLLRNKLNPVLPYSLPLYRRCQWYLHQCRVGAQQGNHIDRPGEAEVWVALALPTSTNVLSSADWLTSWLQTPHNPVSSSNLAVNREREYEEQQPEEWIACHLDLREPGQTQVWSFGSWEAVVSPKLMTSNNSDKGVSGNTHPDPSPSQIAIGRALFHRLRSHHIPTLSPTPSAQYLTMKAAGKIVSSPYKRSKVLFGTMAEASWWMFNDNIVKGSDSSQPPSHPSSSDQSSLDSSLKSHIARKDHPYLKYLLALPLPATSSNSTTSPTVLVAKPLETRHLQAVLDNSVIPRTLETLQSLLTIGLFPSPPATANTSDFDLAPDPISWGMLGKDASLSSLHTEPEYRGQRLAERVTRELIANTDKWFQTQLGADENVVDDQAGTEVPWVHVDVSTSNIASQRVFEKMGAKIGWKVGWIEVDVGEEISNE